MYEDWFGKLIALVEFWVLTTLNVRLSISGCNSVVAVGSI